MAMSKPWGKLRQFFVAFSEKLNFNFTQTNGGCQENHEVHMVRGPHVFNRWFLGKILTLPKQLFQERTLI
jgi:hypothetical protein